MSFRTVTYRVEGNVGCLTFNRPSRYNAFNLEAYAEIPKVLEAAEKDDQVHVLLVTGAGKYFSSGNDLSNFKASSDGHSPQELMEISLRLLRVFTRAFLHFPKVLVAAVNGPSYGIAATILCMFDFIYMHHTASLTTPFMKLAQSPEGCSSILMYRRMGVARSHELLLLGRTLSAESLLQCGFANHVSQAPQSEFLSEVKGVCTTLANHPPEALREAKKLLVDVSRAELDRAVDVEIELLGRRFTSAECITAVMQFFQRKKAKL